MIEPVLLPFGGDTEGDVAFESPEKVTDVQALPNPHDGMEVVRHGRGYTEKPCPAGNPALGRVGTEKA